MLQLIGQIPGVVVAQRGDQVLHPALPAPQVLVEPIGGRLAPSRLLPCVKFVLKENTERV